MFNILENICKSQNYTKEPKNYIIQNTVFLHGQSFDWFFTSKSAVHQNRILKKLKDNCSIPQLVSFYKIQDVYEELQISSKILKLDQLQDKQNTIIIAVMARKEKSEIKIKYLNKTELAHLLIDYNLYPELYKEVMIYQQIKQDDDHYIEAKFKNNQFMFEVKNSSITKLNDHKEKRLITCMQDIIKGLNIIHFQRGPITEITLHFKEQTSQFILIWCQAIVYDKSSNNQILSFSITESFLYNQELFNQFKRNQIDLQLKNSKILREKKIQCAVCLQLLLEIDSFQVTRGKVWKIRVKRGLNNLNQDKILSKGKQLIVKSEYEFVSVCDKCYDIFLKMITDMEPRLNSSKRQKHYISHQPSDTQDKNQISKSYDISPLYQYQKRQKSHNYHISDSSNDQSNAGDPIEFFPLMIQKIKNKTHPQKSQQFEPINKKVSLLDDFDDLMRDLIKPIPQQQNLLQQNISIQPIQFKVKQASTISKQPIRPLKQQIESSYTNEQTEIYSTEPENKAILIYDADKYTDSQRTVKQFQKRRVRSFSGVKASKNWVKPLFENLENVVNSQFDHFTQQNDQSRCDLN